MHRHIHRAPIAAALALLLAACGGTEPENAAANDAGPDQAEQLVSAANESWINLEGTVAAVSPTSFLLDYGDGNVTVEMDDWDWFQEGRHLQAGDEVAVTGRVDRDLLERATLEAQSVFVENLGTYFYASGRDEEDLADSSIYMVAPAGSVDATGFVTAIEGREFTLGTDAGAMRVDTTRMANNPLDAAGQPQVRIADRVYVWGRLDLDAREPDELMADGIVLLSPDRAKSDSEAQAGTEPQSPSNMTGNAAEPAPPQ